jgi:hypothetical protein
MIDTALTGAPLLDAGRILLREELLPALSDSQRHAALMLVNALAIAKRALHEGEGNDREELASLGLLLGLPRSEAHAGACQRLQSENRLLCARIRAGHADEGPWRDEVLAHLRATCRRQLAVSNPKVVAAVGSQRREPT